ncbi:MAG: type I restriction enzyme HsdR N-terminal domain-containing protein [Saprospiraceae bacterium]
MFLNINYLPYQSHLRTKRDADRRYVFCCIRKKYLVWQPEEMVRQLVLHYLIEEKKYNRQRIRAEKLVVVNSLRKRCDILVYDTEVKPLLLVECKRPEVPITQDVFKQIAWYNMPLQVKYLVVTNGLQTYCCEMDYEKQDYQYLSEIPNFAD